jgi:molecular chaperone DnaJ
MNPYKILEVSKNATEEEIKKAYRKKAFELHPDRCPGDEVAAKKFKEVQNAYETLTKKKNQQINFDDFAQSIFGDFFSFNQPFTQRGRDIQASTEIEFLQSVTGCEKEVELRRGESCKSCNGTGATSFESCSICHGHGMMSYRQGNVTVKTTCNQCGGKGKTITKECSDCNGDGVVKDTVKIKVRIPEGINDGDQIRLMGQGEQKEVPGDAYIRVRVKSHHLFKRENLDIKIIVPITFTQAVFGTTMNIPTVSGIKEITIPPSSKSGDQIKMPNMGFLNPQSRWKGNFVAELMIDTTMPTDEKLLNHLKELANLEIETEIIKEFKQNLQT